MPGEQFVEIPLSNIRANPHNPRQRFDGPEFENLEKSIENVGVLQPILCRPIKDKDVTHEVVFGGRRFQASCNIAARNGGLDAVKILVRVKELTDDEAFDFMTIENLQRDDLTPLEEANSFKSFVDRRGRGGITALADRVNINERYIRRRLSVLPLPKAMLKAWDQGKVKFTHLEQIARLPNEKDRSDVFQEAVQRELSTKEIRRHIESNSPVLDAARFDRDKAGCPKCESNSDIQAETHGHKTASKNAVCLNLNCFKKNQNNYFLKNWKKTGFYKQHKTTGFRFFKDFGWGNFNHFGIYKKATEKCKKCDKFVTLLELDGTARESMACLGEDSCYSAQGRVASSQETKSKKKKADPNAPRVAWHGEHFREIFFKQRIPERLNEIKHASGIKSNSTIDRLFLLTLIKQSRAIHAWFARRHELASENTLKINSDWFSLGTEKIFNAIEKMNPAQVRDELHAVVSQIIISSEYFADNRRLVADHIGIDLATEWTITEEYLQKKTKGEMMTIGEVFKIFKDRKAQSFLFEKLIKKRGKFNTCKKGELIRVFTESGVDLKGKVPAEILAS